MLLDVSLIAGWVGAAGVIVAPVICIWRFIDKTMRRMDKLELQVAANIEEVRESKTEMLILLKGQLACLKGLKEQGCNGPVTQSIKEMEDYILQKSH